MTSTARERARESVVEDLKAVARRHLAEHGAAGLSLRAVARDLGVAPSAPYRYVGSRDGLLTLLVVDAYDDLGSAVEQADETSDETGATPRERWRAVCAAVRGWAREHPAEYGLVYGTPVPGYAAPRETVAPAARVVTALVRVVALGDAATAARRLPSTAAPLPDGLRGELDAVADALGVELVPEQMARGVVAWSQLFGLVSLELFGHLVGGFEPADAVVARSVETTADLLGLPPDGSSGKDG